MFLSEPVRDRRQLHRHILVEKAKEVSDLRHSHGYEHSVASYPYERLHPSPFRCNPELSSHDAKSAMEILNR